MPLTQIDDYLRPADLDAAWRALQEGDGAAHLLGGGTDLVVRCPPKVSRLIDLSDVGLRYVQRDERGWLRIGAMSTFTDLLEHPAVSTYGTGVVGEMLTQVGSVLHRNSATIGGHVVRSRLSDVLPVLVALDAIVVTYAGTGSEQPIGDYLDADLGPHVVVEVRLPPPVRGMAAAFVRFSRTSFDHALVNVCCRVDLDDEVVVNARVIVGESTAVGRRVSRAEEALVGSLLTPETAARVAQVARDAVELHGDWIASSEYRHHLAGVAVARCLNAVADRAEGGAP